MDQRSGKRKRQVFSIQSLSAHPKEAAILALKASSQCFHSVENDIASRFLAYLGVYGQTIGQMLAGALLALLLCSCGGAA